MTLVRTALIGILGLVLSMSLVGAVPRTQARSAALLPPPARSIETAGAIVMHFDLAEMTRRAATIMRATVLEATESTLDVGGGRLPTVTYRLQVEESFKGLDPVPETPQTVEVRMLGTLKQVMTGSGIRRFPILPSPPLLQVGSDYLLLLTAPSTVGLSSPVGLSQGRFQIISVDKQEWVQSQEGGGQLLPSGEIPYAQMAARIRALLQEKG